MKLLLAPEQFLVKPIQQKIMSAHFSRATLYALMANCLQFEKEIHLNPGNSGASQTRAMVSELLAIKLLREYTTRELIDALSYEFYPLQGQDPTTAWASGLQRKRLAEQWDETAKARWHGQDTVEGWELACDVIDLRRFRPHRGVD